MQTKLIEITEVCTSIPALAIELDGSEVSPLARKVGFRGRYILLMKLSSLQTAYGPESWYDRTMKAAHSWLLDNWPLIQDGGVVDVEKILEAQETGSEASGA